MGPRTPSRLMDLGPVLFIDCLAFIACLVPQLFMNIGILDLATCILWAAPNLVLICIHFCYEHAFDAKNSNLHIQRAGCFEDFVIRCTRYAFANIPATIGAIFLSRPVSHPFFRFRLLRQGHFKSPVQYQDIKQAGFSGVWLVCDPKRDVDFVIYYLHGGGFSMGSCFFYLEFLMTWLTTVRDAGLASNPGLFAVEYSLVPTATFPVQLQEVKRGYDWILKKNCKTCIAGDSAGATLALSLLLWIAKEGWYLPDFATLISPWCELASDLHSNRPLDYLDADSLTLYAQQYVAAEYEKDRLFDPISSPGCCRDPDTWKRASPRHGFHFIWGAEEVLAPSARRLAKLIEGAGIKVTMSEAQGAVHAWPVVDLFLKNSKDQRLGGIETIVSTMGRMLLINATP